MKLAIRGLTAPVLQHLLPALQDLAAKKIQIADKIIRVRRAEGFEAGTEAMRTGQGRQIMAAFLTVARQFQEAELNLLSQRHEEAENRFRQSKFALLLGSLLGVGITIGAGWSVKRDLQKRKIAEAALFVEKDRALVTLNSIGDAVICTGTSGMITFLNGVAEKLTGWSAREATGRPMAEVLQIINSANREIIANPMLLAMDRNETMHLPPDSLLIGVTG